MKKIFSLLIFIFSLSVVFGQNYPKIDSLKQILKTLPELDGTDADTTRLKAYLDIGDLFEYYIPDSAIYWYKKAADTIFTQEHIELYFKRSAINLLSYRYTGNVYADMGEYVKSKFYYEKSLRISEVLDDKIGVSNCLICLGIIHKNIGEFPKAIDNYEKALRIKEELNDKQSISMCLNNLGIVYRSLGDYRKAAIFYERSLVIDEELGDKRGISTTLVNIGTVYFFLRDYTKTIDCYEKSLQIAYELDDKQRISANHMGLGNVYLDQNEFIKSSNYYEKSLLIAEELGDKKGIASCLHNLGNVNHNLGAGNTLSQLERDSLLRLASVYYMRSLKIKEELGVIAELASDYPSLARNYLLLKKPDKARPLLINSLEITLSLLRDNFSILSEKEKEMYLNKTKQIFNELHFFNINYPIQNDSISQVCYNNELILKGLLLKSTAGIMNVVYNSPDAEIKETYFLLKEYRDRISSIQGIERGNRDSLIVVLENKANEQERKLVKMSSEFADIQQLFECNWKDVQKALKLGEAAIEFVSFTQGIGKDTVVYAALIITPECKMPVSIKLFNNYELQDIIGKSTGTGYIYVSSLYNTSSTALYNRIWKPLEIALVGIKTVYYAPSGVLNNISFPALLKESGVLLCDYIELVQLSTTGKLINKQDVQTKQNLSDALVFGGIDYNPELTEKEIWAYLPGTLTELQSLEKTFKKGKIKYSSFSGKEAKEETFKELFANNTSSPGILHISTHGFFYPEPELVKKEENKAEESEIKFRGGSGFGNWMFLNNKNPMMRSGLVFAGANRVWSEDWGRTDNEGVLTAYEVSNLNMRNTHLVVLSACETGLGDIKGSEGVYGLQRAFKMAGVKYIIMSLWQVPDKETVEFMEKFYKKLLKEKDVRQAFNETQKEMRKKYDPYFWAAFVLVE
jgi:CHAT domain-containing protein